MNREFVTKRKLKKDIECILLSNNLIEETNVKIVTATNINALLVCETSINAGIIVESIEDDIDQAYKLLQVDPYKFIVLENK
jgi:hypothetical protein